MGNWKTNRKPPEVIYVDWKFMRRQINIGSSCDVIPITNKKSLVFSEKLSRVLSKIWVGKWFFWHLIPCSNHENSYFVRGQFRFGLQMHVQQDSQRRVASHMHLCQSVPLCLFVLIGKSKHSRASEKGQWLCKKQNN